MNPSSTLKPAVSGNLWLPETAKLTSEATHVQSLTFEVNGIDVSRWQKEVNWERALSAGITFAFIKASEHNRADARNGSAIIDSQFERNMQETAHLGIPTLCIFLAEPASPTSSNPATTGRSRRI